jgi:hypothetical protein
MEDVGGLDRVAANEQSYIELSESRSPGSPFEVECECTNDSCERRIKLRMSEYQPLRSSAACYAICPDDAHVDPAHDLVVERHVRYWVVERRPSLEVLEFYGDRARSTMVEVTVGAREDSAPDGTA